MRFKASGSSDYRAYRFVTATTPGGGGEDFGAGGDSLTSNPALVETIL